MQWEWGTATYERTKKHWEHLVTAMLETRGLRFSVAESEKIKEKFSLMTVALLSVYLAAWSFGTVPFPEYFDALQIKLLSLISLVVSVSLLVITLFDYATGRSVFAGKMLQNAFAITEILREAERHLAMDDPDFDRLSQLAEKYEDTVSAAGINHTAADYRLWIMSRTEATGSSHALWIWLKRQAFSWFSFLSAMSFQVLLLVFICLSTVAILLL